MCRRKVAIKNYYFELGHKRCHYCCSQLNYSPGFSNSATVEHIILKSKGGTLRRENVLVVCKTCNLKRGNKDFTGFVTGSRLPRQDWLLEKFRKAKLVYNQ